MKVYIYFHARIITLLTQHEFLILVTLDEGCVSVSFPSVATLLYVIVLSDCKSLTKVIMFTSTECLHLVHTRPLYCNLSSLCTTQKYASDVYNHCQFFFKRQEGRFCKSMKPLQVLCVQSGIGDRSTGSSYTDGKTVLSTYEAPKKLYWKDRGRQFIKMYIRGVLILTDTRGIKQQETRLNFLVQELFRHCQKMGPDSAMCISTYPTSNISYH